MFEPANQKGGKEFLKTDKRIIQVALVLQATDDDFIIPKKYSGDLFLKILDDGNLLY